MSFSFVALDGVEYLGVGVGVPLSEQIECSGRLYLFKIPAVCTPTGGNASAEPTAPSATTTNAATAPQAQEGNSLQVSFLSSLCPRDTRKL